jgi:hypothetical protein
MNQLVLQFAAEELPDYDALVALKARLYPNAKNRGDND